MTWQTWDDKGLLPRSLQPLAQIAMNGAGADGYAIYQVNQETEARELKFAWGAPVPETAAAGFTVDSFPLRAGEDVTGIVAFVFRGQCDRAWDARGAGANCGSPRRGLANVVGS